MSHVYTVDPSIIEFYDRGDGLPYTEKMQLRAGDVIRYKFHLDHSDDFRVERIVKVIPGVRFPLTTASIRHLEFGEQCKLLEQCKDGKMVPIPINEQKWRQIDCGYFLDASKNDLVREAEEVERSNVHAALQVAEDQLVNAELQRKQSYSDSESGSDSYEIARQKRRAAARSNKKGPQSRKREFKHDESSDQKRAAKKRNVEDESSDDESKFRTFPCLPYIPAL
jgi:hypothetical protein